MAVRVADGAEDRARELLGPFLVQIRTPSDPAAALRALQLAREEIVALVAVGGSDGAVVSNAVLGPEGPLLRIAGLDADEDVLATIPSLVAESLDEAGVLDATVEVHEPASPLDRLDNVFGAAVLRLFPTPAGEDGVLPGSWIDVASEWVLADVRPRDLVSLRLLGAGYALTAADAPTILHQAAGARGWCDLVQGDLRSRIRTASLTFGGTPHLALAAGGPGCDTPALLARYDLLCDLARELDDGVAYACVDLEATFEVIGLGLEATAWRARGGASPNAVAGALVDVCVPDAFPFQVLGPGHRQRLQHTEDGESIGTPLAGGRLAVELGDAIDWLPHHPTRAEEHERGWKVLAPLLVREDEASELVAARGPNGSAHVVPSAGSGPDLTTITLDAMPHARRGLRLTFLELASWLAHEPHSDAPRAVSPVVAAYARWLAAAVDDERRHQLIPRAVLAVGTRSRSVADDGWRLLPASEDARVWAAVDWLVRVQAPAWLTLAGRGPAAQKLTAVRPKRSHAHLERATTLASSALAALVSDRTDAHDEVADELAWQAWEQVAESSGWVAASEAATFGVPGRLADAVELRLLELTRADRARVRAGSLVDAARTAALDAAALAAWDAGWDAARIAIDAEALIPFDTALKRARAAAATRLGIDRDAVDAGLEAASVAGRDALVAAVLDAEEGTTAWLSVHDSASRSPHGDVWQAVQQLTQGIVDDGPWEAGMAAAAGAAGRVVQASPELIERAIATAVGREAAGAAARAVARDAARRALESGATPDQAAAAASDALAPTAAILTDAAIDLLDALIAIR